MNGKHNSLEQPAALPRLLLLALFFLGGIILGQVLASRVPDATGEELGRYLAEYVHLEDREKWTAKMALSTAILYFRYPLLAFLLGFASVGVALLPLTTAAFGFFLSFSVCCFTVAFGADGIVLALAVFGLRCAITLPCYFLLAVPSWRTSAALASLSLGQGRRCAPIGYGRSWWLRLAVVSAVLTAGICLDLMCGAQLLQLTLKRLM